MWCNNIPIILQLNDNNICRIKAGAFERVPSLRTLALHNNRLTRIHESAFGDTQHRIARLEVAGQYRATRQDAAQEIEKWAESAALASAAHSAHFMFPVRHPV